MTVHLTVVSVDEVTEPLQLFVCTELGAKLSGSTCVKRQAKAHTPRERGKQSIELGMCASCGPGRMLAERVSGKMDLDAESKQALAGVKLPTFKGPRAPMSDEERQKLKPARPAKAPKPPKQPKPPKEPKAEKKRVDRVSKQAAPKESVSLRDKARIALSLVQDVIAQLQSSEDKDLCQSFADGLFLAHDRMAKIMAGSPAEAVVSALRRVNSSLTIEGFVRETGYEKDVLEGPMRDLVQQGVLLETSGIWSLRKWFVGL